MTSFKILLLTFLAFIFTPSVFALNIDWSGRYRVEAVQVNNSSFSGSEATKSYTHHHLVLSPKIIAADGLTLRGRFNILNNSQMANSQFGQFFGNGLNSGGASGTNADNTNVLSERNASETLAVSQLFMTYDWEFVSFMVGRVPLEFGLGLTYSAGNGLFDHWFDTSDAAAFRFDLGNMSFTTMLGKSREGELEIGDDVSDLTFALEYDNPETETSFGINYRSRRSGAAGNDSPTGANGFGGAGSQVTGGFQGKTTNFFLKRADDGLAFGIEGGVTDGDTGVVNSGGTGVSLNGFGVAMELDWTPKESDWTWSGKVGFATGDDPNTTDKFEGFFFDRNYDVALLMFNHVFGQFDALGTSIARNSNLTFGGGNSGSAGSTPDIEALSNVLYFAPSFNWQMSQNWDFGGRLVYATLNEDSRLINGTITDVEKDLGFEVDFSLTFSPHERFTWTSEAGVFFPGEAFRGGGNNFGASTAYGLMTRAAVSF